ncbi:hypothetical protein GCM10027030_13110 [Luteococcus sediminum]
MSTKLKDVIDIPERVEANDYVLKLTDSVGSDAVRRTIDNYVVTDQLTESFDQALGLVGSAIRERESKAAFLAGSFGSGKSHFMAVLHAMLRHEPAAREKAELAPVIARHDADLAGKNILPLAFHLLDSKSMEEAIFSGYLRQIRELHPTCLLPALHRSDGLLRDAATLRHRMGDTAFFEGLGGPGDPDDPWADVLDDSWTAESYDAAVAAAPDSETRQKLVTSLVERYFTQAKDSSDFIDLEGGLAVIATHARSLGYDAVVFFLDELVLWLAFMAQERERFGRESQKLTKLVESSRGRRDIPIISFVARQMDLRKWFADSGASGQEQELIEQGFRFQEGRFAKITLGDDNLPYVASKRLLAPKDAAAQAVLDEAFRRIDRDPRVWDVLLDGSNTDDEHRGASEATFRMTYPFSPALVSTLKSLASVMQRERTALKVMQQMLVDQRETLTVDDVIPVGDAYPYLVQGAIGQAIDEQTARQFRNADTLYLEKLRPQVLQAHQMTEEQLASGAELPKPYQADDRLAKTLLLSAVAPKVPALKNLDAGRLASLNHGSIASPLPGAEAPMVLSKVRQWAQRIPEVRVEGERAGATIHVQLTDVAYETVVDKAKGHDSLENQQRTVSNLICAELGLDPSATDITGALPSTVMWRGTQRPVEIIFGNVRRSDWLPDSYFEPAQTGAWRLVVDYPLDEGNFSSTEDLARVERLKEQGLQAYTLVWLPSFLSESKRIELRRLGVLDWLLENDKRWRDHSDHLSEADRASARAILAAQRDSLRAGLRETLKQVYGITEAQPGVIDPAERTPRLISSFDPVYAPDGVSGTGFQTAKDSLLRGAYDATYPDHPKFVPEDEPVKTSELNLVAQHLVRAIDNPDRRVELVGDKRAVRRVANVLKTGHAAETHFLFGDEHFGDWGTIIEKGVALAGADRKPVSVGALRQILDRVEPARGLTDPMKDLVIIAWGLLRQRAWFKDGAPLTDQQPRPGSLTPGMELRPLELPEKADWDLAVRRAGAIFGIHAQPYLTPPVMAKLAKDVKQKATQLRPAASSLVTELGTAGHRLGVEPGKRLAIAANAHELVTTLAPLDGLTLVRTLASFDLKGTEQATGTSLATAEATAAKIRDLNWDRLMGILDNGQTRPTEIRTKLLAAFGNDEFATALAPALRRAENDAIDWAVSVQPVVPNPEPHPVDPWRSPALIMDPNVVPLVDVTTSTAGVDHVFTASSGESQTILQQLEAFLRAHPGKEVTVRWDLKR